MPPESYHLWETHVSVGRTEQVAFYIFGSLFHIRQIVLGPEADTLNMVESVIAYTMPPVQYHLVDVRMFADVVPDTEEGRLHAIFV